MSTPRERSEGGREPWHQGLHCGNRSHKGVGSTAKVFPLKMERENRPRSSPRQKLKRRVLYLREPTRKGVSVPPLFFYTDMSRLVNNLVKNGSGNANRSYRLCFSQGNCRTLWEKMSLKHRQVRLCRSRKRFVCIKGCETTTA